MGASLSDLVPDLEPFARDLVNACASARLYPQVTSTRRTHSEQARLYRRSLQGLQPYPVAKPGSSPHEQGWAFDMVVTPMSEMPYVAQVWESWGGAWGGQRDPVHFELPGASRAAKELSQTPGTEENSVFWSSVDVGLTALSFTDLPAALLELVYTAASEKEAVKLIQEWNFLTGSHIDPYGRAF